MVGKEKAENDLVGFVRSFAQKRTLTIEEDLGSGYVRLRVTEAEKRQALQDIRSVEDVVKELVRNARDAGSRSIMVASGKEKNRWRHIIVIDDGRGIPEEVQGKIFESRVTSKIEKVVEDSFGVHGRGMALFSIKHTVDSIELFRSEEGRGSIFKAVIDTQLLREKGDQSTLPQILEEDGRLVVNGPHNILRVLAEFLLEPGAPAIYYGSESEILALLFTLSRERLRWERTGNEKGKGSPLWNELSLVQEGKELCSFAREKLGLEVSERTAFRVLEGEISPPPSLGELILRGGSRTIGLTHRSPHGMRSRGLVEDNLSGRLSREDLEGIREAFLHMVEEVGKKYFLRAVDCQVRRSKNQLKLSLLLEEEQ